jgi:hypothetical protein
MYCYTLIFLPYANVLRRKLIFCDRVSEKDFQGFHGRVVKFPDFYTHASHRYGF